jgi:hypothetical protein
VHSDETRISIHRFIDSGRDDDERINASRRVRSLPPPPSYIQLTLLFRRIYAPAPPPSSNPNAPDMDGEGTSLLGLVPHQLRGFLAQFRNIPIVGSMYEKCTGCSESVRLFSPS